MLTVAVKHNAWQLTNAPKMWSEWTKNNNHIIWDWMRLMQHRIWRLLVLVPFLPSLPLTGLVASKHRDPTDIDWPNPRQHWCEDATAAGTKSCHNGSCSKPRCVHHCATCPEDPWKRKRTNFKLMDMERKHSIVQWPKQNINNKFHNLKFDKLKLFHECFGHNLVLTLKFQFWNKKWSKCFFPTFGIKSWSHQAASTFRGRADASDTVDGRNLAPPVMILRCMKPY